MSDIALPQPRRMPRNTALLAVALLVAILALAGGFAWPHVAGVLSYKPALDRLFAKLHNDPVLIEALRDQNSGLADKDAAWALAQDGIWNAERKAGGGPLQQSYMERPASLHLAEIVRKSDGLIGHAFLIDARGRMAAVPFLSFNFWQFDKPKFYYTYPLGADARDVSWLQLSWDGGHLVCWRAETMLDPTTGEPIGALALEVNYDKVGYFGCRETPAHTPEERATNHVKL